MRLRRSEAQPTNWSPSGYEDANMLPAKDVVISSKPAAFASTLVRALGVDTTRPSLTRVHVRAGLAYASDGHRLHAGPTTNADGVYAGLAKLVDEPFCESMTNLKCDGSHEVELTPAYVFAIRSWANVMVNTMKLIVPVNAGIEHAMVSFNVTGAARARAKNQNLDRMKIYVLHVGNPPPREPPEGSVMCKPLVYVNADYLLDAVAHAGLRVRFAGELDPVEFLSEHGHPERAFVMPVRP